MIFKVLSHPNSVILWKTPSLELSSPGLSCIPELMTCPGFTPLRAALATEGGTRPRPQLSVRWCLIAKNSPCKSPAEPRRFPCCGSRALPSGTSPSANELPALLLPPARPWITPLVLSCLLWVESGSSQLPKHSGASVEEQQDLSWPIIPCSGRSRPMAATH